MGKEEENVADVTFITEELKRFARMSLDEAMQHLRQNRDDGFATLRAPGGHGDLICGSAAYQKFDDIADRMVKGAAQAKRFTRRNYVHALHDAFAEIFIEKGREISKRSVARFIARANDIVRSELTDVTHHIPCVLFSQKEPSEFMVGPVRFVGTDLFFSESENRLREYHESTMEDFCKAFRLEHPGSSDAAVRTEAGERADADLQRIRDYYQRFDWVAQVTVPSCDNEMSTDRAEMTVDAALDLLRLFVGSLPDLYRRANAPGLPSLTRVLTTGPDGRITPTTTWRSQGAPLMENWYEQVMAKAGGFWRPLEESINILPTGDRPDELTQRLLDALQWFGQAVVEPQPSGMILKYTAALERLTITGHVENGLEALVIRRVDLLNSDRNDKQKEEIRQSIGQLYQCRSDLLHGSLSPYSEKIQSVLRTGWEVTRWTLLNAAQHFAHLKGQQKTNRKDLSLFYDAWEAGGLRKAVYGK
jgi:hypothetical protein